MAWGKRNRASSAGAAKRRRTGARSRARSTPPSFARASVSTGNAFGSAAPARKKTWNKRSKGNGKSFWAKVGPKGFDPFIYKNPVPVPGVMATSTYVESSRMLQINVTSGNMAYLILSFSMTDIRLWYVSGTTIFEYTMPNLTNSGAREVRPGRLAMDVANTTQTDHVGGYIRAVNVTDPLGITFASSSTLTAESVTMLADIVSQDGRVKQFTGQQAAGKPLRFVCKPSNMQKVIEHNQYANHASGQETSEWNMGQLNSGMSTYLVQISAPGQQQTYYVQTISQDFLRFNEGTMMSNTHKAPPGKSEGFDRAAQAQQIADSFSGWG